MYVHCMLHLLAVATMQSFGYKVSDYVAIGNRFGYGNLKVK